MDDAETVWQGCASLLREQVSGVVWSSSFQNVEPISYDGDTLVLGFPSSIVRDRVQERYLGLMRANLAEMGLPGVSVTLQARPPAPQELPLFDELADIRRLDEAPAANGAPASAAHDCPHVYASLLRVDR